MGEVMSSVSFRSNAQGANGIRTKQVFTRFGWCEVRHPYRVGSPGESDVFKAFGVVQKMTPSASKVATTLAVTQGSFREAKDTLALLGCGNVSASKLRKETLRVGEARLAALRKPARDVRQYSDAELRTPDGARRVPRTLVVMADGTNPPCTKADTAGVRGKNSAQAKSRQLRVTCACEYVSRLEGIGNRPARAVRRRRGGGAGEGDARRTALRQVHQRLHARGWISEHLLRKARHRRRREGIQDMPRHHAPTRRGLRRGPHQATLLQGTGIIGRGERRAQLPRQKARQHALRLAEETRILHIVLPHRGRRENPILVARRCKQAGMHWRHHNAACVCAIIAQLRSAA